MNLKLSLCAATLCLMTNIAVAEDDIAPQQIQIPVIEDAQVFAEFIDGYPAMTNYFTESSFEQVTSFYTEKYGPSIEQQTRYGRLELKFSDMGNVIRVIVAKQNNRQEVDVMIESPATEE